MFSWVRFTEYLGLRPALDADLEISPRLESHGAVRLEQAAYRLAYQHAADGFTIENLADVERTFRVDLAALYPSAKAFRTSAGKAIDGTPFTLAAGATVTITPA